MEGEKQVLLDTSVLINFAAIDRIDLLSALTAYSFLVTDHVRDEVQQHFTDQYAAVNAAIADGTLQKRSVNSSEELADFAALIGLGNLGEGECSAIAAAKKHSFPLAIDDKSARKKALVFHSGIELLGTEDLMLSIIQAGILTIEQADAIKNDWEANHRFKLMFASFAEKLS